MSAKLLPASVLFGLALIAAAIAYSGRYVAVSTPQGYFLMDRWAETVRLCVTRVDDPWGSPESCRTTASFEVGL